ncbi:MAG: 16S rRNA (guanine(966)-N(2))-methyltransferase RsmD [Bdellovibrionales bacterium]
MRIISGKFGGRRLVSFQADHIRPTTDRVKESLFNILRDACEEARVLDLFAGTGNLSIEALSRGARSVEAVELNQKSIDIIKKNLELLKITEIQVIKKDVFSYLKKYVGEGFDLIFVDPPFTEKLAHDVMLQMSESQVFRPHTHIAIESARKERIEDEYGNLVCIDRREFGDKILSFFQQRLDEKGSV